MKLKKNKYLELCCIFLSFPVATLGVSEKHKQEDKLVFSLHKMGTDDD